jgi:KDO2-lipid IV(A) lauroyltransferase
LPRATWSCASRSFPRRTQRLLKENFASTGIAFFEMAMSWWWPQARLARLAHVEGLEHLQAAQRDGKGVILMAVHFTTLEIGAALLGQQHTIDGMYREHGNPLFDFIQRRGRERHNLDSLAVERDDVRGMLKLLRGPGDLVRARPGLRRQAEHLRAAVRHPGRHRYRHQQVRPPGQGPGDAVHPEAPGRWQRLPPGDPSAARRFPGETEEADCLRINQWVEGVLRECPEQYLWAHRRFKSRPEGEPRLYDKR